MKKIDILNFITNYRQAPNDIKTHAQLLQHLGAAHEAEMNQMIAEMKSLRALREVEHNGEKAYQVMSK